MLAIVWETVSFFKMNNKFRNLLTEARVHYRACRLLEAYHLLRRYFDRMPFQFDPEHAEFIGLFVKVLVGLGRENELKFYLDHVKRLYDTTASSELGFALGVLYTYAAEPRLERARTLFDAVVADPAARFLHAKAKMFLAHYHDSVHGDVATCRKIIESIDEPEEFDDRVSVEIWRAKLLRDEGKLEAAEVAYLAILERIAPMPLEETWYSVFHVQLGLAYLELRRGAWERAARLTEKLRQIHGERQFYELQLKLEALEKKVQEAFGRDALRFFNRGGESWVRYADKAIQLQPSSPTERLLLSLGGAGRLNKRKIVRALYSRSYRGPSDDQLVQNHVHALRDVLMDLGLPPSSIVSEGRAYRFVPKLMRIEEEP